MRVVAMASQKGGSGKTTLSGHLAVQAQRAGAGPVVIIDIDPQGSLSEWWNERTTEYPAFAQTTVSRLASDLEILREQGFGLAVIDTPPAITMAIQSVIAVADLIVIPTRPSPHDLRAVGATVDLCDRAGKQLIFVVNAATPKARITADAAVALSQHGTVAPVTLASAHRFRRVDDRWPHGDGSRSQRAFRQPRSRPCGTMSPTGSKRISAARYLLRPPPASARAGAWRRLRSPGGGPMTRPLASLSSSLLARPGAAKPAMRPQGFSYSHAEDLGWNDMGGPAPAQPVLAPVPPVLVERAELAKAVTPARKAPPRAKAEPATHKAAFTLRLDPDRHLRLRLASAVAGRSSQQLLVDALDALLDSNPQVETLARQLPASTNRQQAGRNDAGRNRFSGEKS